MSGRLAVVLLIPAGALAGHATAYAVSDGHSHTGLAHGYLSGVSLASIHRLTWADRAFP